MAGRKVGRKVGKMADWMAAMKVEKMVYLRAITKAKIMSKSLYLVCE